jgi:hypothetical protein
VVKSLGFNLNEFSHEAMELNSILDYIPSMPRATDSKIRILMWSIVVTVIVAAFIYNLLGD